jgi:hypothetical protein
MWSMCRSYQKSPQSVVLDIDDTVDVVHGHLVLTFGDSPD